MKKLAIALVVLVAVGLAAAIQPFFHADAQNSNKFRRANAKAIKGQYIVVLRKDADPDVNSVALSRDFGGDRSGGFTYRNAIKGFSVRMNEAQACRHGG